VEKYRVITEYQLFDEFVALFAMWGSEDKAT